MMQLSGEHFWQFNKINNPKAKDQIEKRFKGWMSSWASPCSFYVSIEDKKKDNKRKIYDLFLDAVFPQTVPYQLYPRSF